VRKIARANDEATCERYPLHDTLFLDEQNNHDELNKNLTEEVIPSDFLHRQDQNTILAKENDMDFEHGHSISSDHKDNFVLITLTMNKSFKAYLSTNNTTQENKSNHKIGRRVRR